MQTGGCKRKPDFGACKETARRRQKENGIAIKRTNGQRKLEQRTARMFSATWKLEDIFPGWSRTKLEDWGSSDPWFFKLSAALLAFELGEALGFGDDEEEMRWAEQYFIEMFLEKQLKTELLQGEAAAPKRSSPWRGCSKGSGTRGSSSKKSRPGRRGAAAPRGATHAELTQGEQQRTKLPPEEQHRRKLLQRKQHEVQLLQEEQPITVWTQGEQQKTGGDSHAQERGGDSHARDRGGHSHAQDRGGDSHAQDRGGDLHAQDRGEDSHAQDRGGDSYAQDKGGDSR
jgi:hypothetical protein